MGFQCQSPSFSGLIFSSDALRAKIALGNPNACFKAISRLNELSILTETTFAQMSGLT